MLNWTWPQYQAAGKHIASYVAGGVTMAAALHFISPQQAVDVNGNLKDIFSGLQQVATGVAGLVAFATPFYTAWRAQHNSTPQAQALSLVKEVPGTIIVTKPEVAEAASPNIVSTTEMKVVPKS